MASIISRQIYQSLQSINLIDDREKRDAIFKEKTDIDKENTTKRDFKKEGLSSQYIFSYSSMQNVCNVGKDFANFLQSQGITKVWKITPQLARQFLDLKASQGASPNTLLSYRANLIKINHAIIEKFDCRGFCRGDANIQNYEIARPEKIDRRLDNNQIRQILQEYNGKYALAFKIQADFGLRFNEIKNLSLSDFTIGPGREIETVKQGIVNTSNTVFIHSGTKGGLSRCVSIPESKITEYRAILEQLQGGKNHPFAFLDKGNYNRAIKNIADSLGFGKVGSSHEFRKFYASTRYQEEIRLNMTRSEKLEIARNIVKDLGHGRARDDLIRTYIGNL